MKWCLAFMSLSVVSLIYVYKFGRKRHKRVTFSTSMFALNEDQTVLAVVDEHNSMHFYVGHEKEDKYYE